MPGLEAQTQADLGGPRGGGGAQAHTVPQHGVRLLFMKFRQGWCWWGTGMSSSQQLSSFSYPFPTLPVYSEKTAVFANVPGLINKSKGKKRSILTFGCKRHIFQEPETAKAADSQLLPESSSSLFSECTSGSCFISPGVPNVWLSSPESLCPCLCLGQSLKVLTQWAGCVHPGPPCNQKSSVCPSAHVLPGQPSPNSTGYLA